MHPVAKHKIESYPKHISTILYELRDLILLVAREDNVEGFEETIKWGEPSFISKAGSTVRIDWKEKSPQEVCVYFNCKTLLVETFKEIYGDTFSYLDNRAIILNIDNPIPVAELKHCISMSLRYHKIKHLPLLGT